MTGLLDVKNERLPAWLCDRLRKSYMSCGVSLDSCFHMLPIFTLSSLQLHKNAQT